VREMRDVTKPSRKGPLWALAISLYFTGSAFVDAFVDTEEDRWYAMAGLPVTLLFVVLSCWWLERRFRALDRWKEDRELAWWLRDLPPMPEDTA
jgi:uncharacterized membrane protein YhdT